MIVKPIYNFKAHLSQFLIGKVELQKLLKQACLSKPSEGKVSAKDPRSQFLIGKV